jgi:glycerophosphoryl diester phosphodiesterase
VSCLLGYEGTGWFGVVPEACQDTVVMLPINVAPFVWGWPNLFLERMQRAGSEVILLGPYSAGDPGTSGIDTPEQLAQVPDSFSGYIWTNKIETIGPLVRDRFK